MDKEEEEEMLKKIDDHGKVETLPAVVEGSKFDVMEKYDEEIVVNEILGNANVDKYIYSFQQDGKPVVGLTLAGTKCIARKLGNLSITDLKVVDNEDKIYVIAKCENLDTKVTYYGASEQNKHQILTNGKKIVDKFCLAKACSKSQRNSLRMHIPEEMIISMTEEFIKRKKERQ